MLGTFLYIHKYTYEKKLKRRYFVIIMLATWLHTIQDTFTQKYNEA